ncbi:malonic semialdehyde reductase [Goodfellowiella coeruleoviolacea]|uniref:3-hydroxypropanoate dehydrogenase n=1 Tax=Goodfellowiella coeruleoviolacea TaxID=334858 RepID=A0AAE3GES3_9PSEU|nr:malonic semialdehyde reductase [Goodfellowiella coeruleoviolacea]MCP2166398.1 3-hydroxypropanoate dehydrogenase [Goodfellowiella coeruleoviolacea]
MSTGVPTLPENGLHDVLALAADAQNLLFRAARTANAFTDEPVTDEQLRAVLDLAKWGPTAMNSQPLRVVFLRSAEARGRLLPHMFGGNRDKTAKAPVTAILAADGEFHELLPTVFPAVPNAREMFADDEELRLRSARLSAALQIGYFIVAVRAAGLAVGPMTGFDVNGVRAEFFAGTGTEPLVVANIGHADHTATYPRAPRLGFDEVATVL